MKINRCFNHLRIIIKNSVLLMKTSEQLECNCRCSEYNTVCRLLVKGWDYFSSWDPRSKTWPWPQQPAHNQKMSLFSAPIAVVGFILQTIKGDIYLVYCWSTFCFSSQRPIRYAAKIENVVTQTEQEQPRHKSIVRDMWQFWVAWHGQGYTLHVTRYMIQWYAGDEQLDLRTI